jgi:hypothetical protein
MDYPRSAAREALQAVLSDDHNAQAGDAAAQEIIARVATEQGEHGLQRLAFDLVLKLAELTERSAVERRLTAVDLADILFLD